MLEQLQDLLGRYARDMVTNFEGVVTTVSLDLYGCVQVVLTPGKDKEGRLIDGHWFDVNRVVITSLPDHKIMRPPNYEAYKSLHDYDRGAAEKPPLSSRAPDDL
jgi:hypothetical protein